MRLSLRMLTVLCWMAFGLWSVCAQQPAKGPDKPIESLGDLPPMFKRVAIGVTRRGTPIEAVITSEDLDLATSKARILIVGGLDGSPTTRTAVLSVLHRFYTDESYKPLREVFSLSGIPCGNPDGYHDQVRGNNGVGGNPARGYPPTTDAYNSPTNPESQYIWRWIGMHAPDMVIELSEGETTESIAPGNRPTDSLGAQLEKMPAGGVGVIEVETRSVKPGDIRPFADLTPDAFEKLAEAVKQEGTKVQSPARRELLSRQRRTAIEIGQQLSKVYGHDLSSVAYIPAVACLGRLQLAQLTNDSSCLPDLVRLAHDYHAGTKPTLTDKSSSSDVAGHILWGHLFDATQDRRYIELARAAADRAFDTQGQPLPAMPAHSEMSDAVFMGCPILAQVGRVTGQSKYFDMCLRHMRFMLKLNLREDGLHRHSPLDQTAWGRGNGFPALGLALSLGDLPAEHAGRAEMLAAYRAHLQALLPHQDVTGMWHQVIDHAESYREFTATCMITYAMARGVREGWLERATYAPAISQGWNAIKLRIAADGQLVDVCTGTGKMKSLREYLDRTAILGKDPRGGAMALMVTCEMIRFESSQRQ